MATSKYWEMQKQIKRLKKQKKKTAKELEIMRQRDVLQKQVKRQKQEKFYRSKLGKFTVASRKAWEGSAETRKKARKTMAKAYKDLSKLE